VNLTFLKKYPFALNMLQRNLGYYADQVYAYNSGVFEQCDDHTPNVMIVAKRYCQEQLNSFASISRKELNQIIANKKKSAAHILFNVIPNSAIDGYDVKECRIDEEVVKRLSKAKFLLPETALLSVTNDNQVYCVDTPLGKVFSGGTSARQKVVYAKGLLADVEYFKLSAGLTADSLTQEVSQQELAEFYIGQLLAQEVSSIKINLLFDASKWFNPVHLHALYMGPLLTALLFYTATNGYFYFKQQQLDANLGEGRGEVSQVLDTRNKIANISAQVDALSNEFSGQELVHRYWQVVYDLVELDVDVTRITYKNGELTVRGLAEQASNVLTEIAKKDKVISASFQGPVRKSRSKDSFVLKIQLAS